MKAAIFLAVFALLVGCAVSYVPYREFDPFQLTSPNSCSNYTSDPNWLSFLKTSLKEEGRSDRLVLDYSSLNTFSEDYGHYVHRQPVAAYAATSAKDVSILVKIAAKSRGTRNAFQIVNRGGSGNSGGFAQPYCQAAMVVLDLTAINGVNIQQNFLFSTAWVGAGANWEKFVTTVAKKNLRPTVVPDYLGLTIGGLLSNGGLGHDTVRFGPVIEQIVSAQIVNADGDIDVVSCNDLEFDRMRGGMGQFGVFIKAQFILMKNEPVTRVFHVLTANMQQLSSTVRYIFKTGLNVYADGLQTFGIHNDRDSIVANVAPEAEISKYNNSIKAITGNGKNYTYYIEFLIRGSSAASLPTRERVQAYLAGKVDTNLIFFTDYDTPTWDNRLELFTIPFLVTIGAWQAPHPWGSFFFDGRQNTETYFDSFYQKQDNALDLGFGLVFLYPYPKYVGNNDTSLVTPHGSNEIFWHVTVGRTTTIPGTYDRQAQSNRALWNGLNTVGDASFYPNGVLPNTNVDDWKQHFGGKTPGSGYRDFVDDKNKLDLNRVFADVRNLY